jgi:RNA recognition motif-containing protein
MQLADKIVFVGPFLKRVERVGEGREERFTNVYVKNLADDVDDDGLKKLAGEYGPVTSAVIMTDSNGKSRGFGFVNFENSEAAGAAVEALNGKDVDGKTVFAGRAQKKAEREALLRAKFEEVRGPPALAATMSGFCGARGGGCRSRWCCGGRWFACARLAAVERTNLKPRATLQVRAERVAKYQGMNLYIKNLADDVNDDVLREEFAPYGTITSHKVGGARGRARRSCGCGLSRDACRLARAPKRGTRAAGACGPTACPRSAGRPWLAWARLHAAAPAAPRSPTTPPPR